MLGRFRLGHPPLGDRPVCMPVHPWSPKIRTEMNWFNVIRKPEYWNALDNPFVFRKRGGFTRKALDGLKHIQDAWPLGRVNKRRNSSVPELGGWHSRYPEAEAGHVRRE